MGATAVLLGGYVVGKVIEKVTEPDSPQKQDAPKTPPIPTLTPADAQQAASDAGNAMKAQLKKNQGRMSTLLTGPTGLGTTNPANLQYKSLLGQ